MGERPEDKDQERIRLILLTSFFIIMILAVFMHLSTEKTQSLVAVFLIAIVVLTNISYLFGKFGKRAKK